MGYTQGDTLDPTYKEVKSGTTGHVEAVMVRYDPTVTSFEKLLHVYWNRHEVGGKFDPTLKDRQGNDKGSQYRSGIYFFTEDQKEAALASKREAKEKLKPWQKIYVEVKPATTFYVAEENHQQYLSEKGGRRGNAQNPGKGVCDAIRCYG